MSLFKNQALTQRNQKPVSQWQSEMNNLFNRFGRDFGSFDFGANEYLPKVEVMNKEKKYLISAEVPGMTEKDINVTLKDNALILEGERKNEVTEEKEDYTFSEFSYGSFYRSIPLDDEVNPDSVKATYKDGILKVELEKIKATTYKTKKIEVLKS